LGSRPTHLHGNTHTLRIPFLAHNQILRVSVRDNNIRNYASHHHIYYFTPLLKHLVEYMENTVDVQHFTPMHGEMCIPWTTIKIPGIQVLFNARVMCVLTFELHMKYCCYGFSTHVHIHINTREGGIGR
jgi:hypothetical protein